MRYFRHCILVLWASHVHPSFGDVGPFSVRVTENVNFCCSCLVIWVWRRYTCRECQSTQNVFQSYNAFTGLRWWWWYWQWWLSLMITGYKNFCSDVEMMVGHKPNIYWLATWLVITPVGVVVSTHSAQTKATHFDGNMYISWFCKVSRKNIPSLPSCCAIQANLHIQEKLARFCQRT